MGVLSIQFCEMCGKKRRLARADREDLGGWRKLESGNRAVTLCISCISAIVDHALERDQNRFRFGTKEVAPLILNFDINERNARMENKTSGF